MWAQLQRLDHVAAGKDQTCHRAFTVGRDFQTRCQSIGDAHADAMQATGKAVGAALALVKLASGVQPRENQFNDGCVLFRMHAKRNAATVVLNADRAVGLQQHLDFLAMSGQGLIGCVVQRLLNHMQRRVGAGVHARALLDRLQPLEDADGRF